MKVCLTFVPLSLFTCFPRGYYPNNSFLPQSYLGFLSLLSLLSREKVGIEPIREGRSRLVLMKEEAWMSYCTFIECRIEALVEGSIEALLQSYIEALCGEKSKAVEMRRPHFCSLGERK